MTPSLSLSLVVATAILGGLALRAAMIVGDVGAGIVRATRHGTPTGRAVVDGIAHGSGRLLVLATTAIAVGFAMAVVQLRA